MDKCMFSLEGKMAVITGGAQGIGKVVADQMAGAGAELALVDMNLELAKATADEISAAHGVRVLAYECDVTKPSEVNAVMDKIEADFGKLDVLFNNAGICMHKPALELAPEEWLKVIDVNLNGVYYVAVAFARKLVAAKRPGSIINTASMSGHIVNWPQKQASYNASKAAVVHLTKSLAVEWVEYNIRVNSLSPGYIWSEMTAQMPQELRDSWLSQIPYGRMGTPQELGGAVIYLASDCSGYTSGTDIIVDGAFTCV